MVTRFLGIGAQKCATTWLYDILSDHPEVCLSAKKEIDFFSAWYDHGYQWYERHFAVGPAHRACGEVSPSYFHGTEVPQRVHSYAPDSRLILFLREPVQRAVSNHRHEVRIGHLTGDDLSFEFGLSNNPQYIDQGLYATHLEKWLEFFELRQILIVLFDDIKTDSLAVARRVYAFLGIDEAHVSAALTGRSNESYVNRFGGLEAAKNGVRGLIRALRLGALWRWFGNLGFRRLYRSVNRMAPDKVIPAPQAATLAELSQRFGDEIERLEQLTGLDLQRWRASAAEPDRG